MKRKVLSLLLTLALCLSLVPLTAVPVHAAEEYDVWVGDTQITSENKDAIPSVLGGTASYDPSSHTLTFNGVTGIRGTSTFTYPYSVNNTPTNVIAKIGSKNVDLVIEGDVIIDASNVEHGIFVYNGSLTMKTDMTITGATDTCIETYGNGDVHAKSGTYNISGRYGLNIYNSLYIEDGVSFTVNATGDDCDGIGSTRLYITNATVDATGTESGIWTDGYHQSGGSVKTRGGEEGLWVGNSESDGRLEVTGNATLESWSGDGHAALFSYKQRISINSSYVYIKTPTGGSVKNVSLNGYDPAVVVDSNGAVATHVLIAPKPTYYDLWVAGTQVHSDNASDLSVISGVTGTANYDVTTNTLTLKGASIQRDGTSDTGTQDREAYGIYYSGNDALTIDVSGETTVKGNSKHASEASWMVGAIESTNADVNIELANGAVFNAQAPDINEENNVIYCAGNLTITGPDTGSAAMTVTGHSYSYGYGEYYGMYVGGNLSVGGNCDLTVTTPARGSDVAGGKITMSGAATLDITGGKNGLLLTNSNLVFNVADDWTGQAVYKTSAGTGAYAAAIMGWYGYKLSAGSGCVMTGYLTADATTGGDNLPDSYSLKDESSVEFYKYKKIVFAPKISYSITISAGKYMSLSSGTESQAVTAGDAITEVVYKADEGYYFPTDYETTPVNGIGVTRDSFTQITVSGTPTAKTTFYPADAKAKAKPAEPSVAATDCTTESNNDGTITGVDSTMEYQKSGDTAWTEITGSTVEGLVPETYSVRIKETETTLASDAVSVTIAEYNAPPKVDAPAFTPASGTTFTETLNVTISIPDNATVYYTTDKSDPSETNGIMTTGAAITLDETTTLKAIAISTDANYENSDVVTATYTKTTPSTGGGGGGATTYPVTPAEVENGKITVSPKNAAEGDKVTITVTPDEGYELDTLTVKDKDGNEIKVKDNGDGTLTIEMPASEIEVEATFKEVEDTPGSDDVFPFVDVPEDAYYRKPVEWAVENGITSGVSEDKYGPELSCTRAQVVTFLWITCGSEDAGTETGFDDVDVDAYYDKAVAWAVEKGITAGTSENEFSPEMTVTRAQFVTMLWVANGMPEVDGEMPFKDVPQDSYYAKAVAWAYANDITAGKSADSFAPDDPCTRGQIMTFLYNAYAE